MCKVNKIGYPEEAMCFPIVFELNLRVDIMKKI